MSLYNRYRPTTLDGVVGQSEAVKVLSKAIAHKSVPRAILFTGESGCGKTTLARIVAKAIGVKSGDLTEINSADFRGIDSIRDLRSAAQMYPMFGKYRVFIIDECHQLTKDAQNAILKLLEDPPKSAFFFLATTEQNKLLKTIRTRCTEISVKPLTESQLIQLLNDVCDAEMKRQGIGLKMEDVVFEQIAKLSNGSARKALVQLEAVFHLDNTDDQLEALSKSDDETTAITLAKHLFDFRVTWKTVANTLKAMTDDPETVRRVVLGYAQAILLNGGKLSARAFEVIQIFRDPLYDVGKPGLTAYCYEIVVPKK